MKKSNVAGAKVSNVPTSAKIEMQGRLRNKRVWSRQETSPHRRTIQESHAPAKSIKGKPSSGRNPFNAREKIAVAKAIPVQRYPSKFRNFLPTKEREMKNPVRIDTADPTVKKLARFCFPRLAPNA